MKVGRKFNGKEFAFRYVEIDLATATDLMPTFAPSDGNLAIQVMVDGNSILIPARAAVAFGATLRNMGKDIMTGVATKNAIRVTDGYEMEAHFESTEDGATFEGVSLDA